MINIDFLCQVIFVMTQCDYSGGNESRFYQAPSPLPAVISHLFSTCNEKLMFQIYPIGS